MRALYLSSATCTVGQPFMDILQWCLRRVSFLTGALHNLIEAATHLEAIWDYA